MKSHGWTRKMHAEVIAITAFMGGPNVELPEEWSVKLSRSEPCSFTASGMRNPILARLTIWNPFRMGSKSAAEWAILRLIQWAALELTAWIENCKRSDGERIGGHRNRAVSEKIKTPRLLRREIRHKTAFA
jgi:hypothetical protein